MKPQKDSKGLNTTYKTPAWTCPFSSQTPRTNPRRHNRFLSVVVVYTGRSRPRSTHRWNRRAESVEPKPEGAPVSTSASGLTAYLVVWSNLPDTSDVAHPKGSKWLNITSLAVKLQHGSTNRPMGRTWWDVGTVGTWWDMRLR